LLLQIVYTGQQGKTLTIFHGRKLNVPRKNPDAPSTY